MTSTLLEKVQAISADIFRIPVTQVTVDSSPQTVQAWDSIEHLNFVLALEQQFGIQFEPEEIERMISIGAVTELLEGRLAKQP